MVRAFTFTILIGIVMLACESYEEDSPWIEWKIPEGTHGQKARLTGIEFDWLSYDVYFDSSAIYQNEDPINQYDINKLFGFSDCDDFHHTNSARFGWRWGTDADSTGLLIYAYNYVKENRNIRYLGTVDLEKSYRYHLKINEATYSFYIEDVMEAPIEMPRGNTCNRGYYYELFPYFGGDETAPHDIYIYRKRNLLERF